jgi:hypothetical protein
MRRSAIDVATVTVVTAGLALLFGGLLPALEARAQTYPPPVGSLSVEAAATEPGGTTDVLATVLDNDGDPVEGADVLFTIVSQPGDDARWDNGELETTETTEADGVATAVLHAGSEPGSIIIETVSGGTTSQVTVAVAEDVSDLPSTGAVLASDGSDGLAGWQIGLLAGAGVALIGGFVVMTGRRDRRA